MKTFLLLAALSFGVLSQAQTTNCEQTWKDQNQTQLTANVNAFVADVKTQIVSAFNQSGMAITDENVEFTAIVTAPQYTRYTPDTGYFYNVTILSNAYVRTAEKVYSFKLLPSSKSGYAGDDFLMIGTFVRQTKEHNSVGDISKLICSAATGFFAKDVMVPTNYLPISQFSIVRVETNIHVGATTELTGPTFGYTDELVTEIQP